MDADSRLHILKNTFSTILNNRKDLLNTFIQQQVKIQLLKNNYAEYVKNNNSALLVFGLDTFHFQSKLLDMEYDELNKFFLIINNRIYCEYFKLYKIIIEYLNKNIKEPKLMDMTKTINRFPVYKDLEPYKQYDIQTISDIHEQIILLLTGFDIFITNKETVFKSHIQKKNIGFNLDNFVNTYNYDITIIREKLSLFLDYIDFFHRIHSKYLNTFSEKLNLMISELNRDIRPDATNDQLVERVIVEESVIEEAVIEEALVEESIVEESVIEEAVVVEALVEESIVEEAVIEEALVEESIVEESVIEEPVVEESVIEEAVIEEAVVVEALVEESIVEEAVIEEAVIEEAVIEEPVIIEEQTVVEESVVIEEPDIVEEPKDQNKDTIIEQLMKEAIIDYKENNNLLSEEITTIKKSINNLKLTVIVEEVEDETSFKSVEEEDFQDEPVVDEQVVIEASVVEETVIEVEEYDVVEETSIEEAEQVVEETVIEEPDVVEETSIEEAEQVVEETVIEEPAVVEEEISNVENKDPSCNDEEIMSELSISISESNEESSNASTEGVLR
uniref:Uncharacterized protein n=1 Tax=viral metagenome TaxID=1070528 RepID=A0A6C0EE19_9ZZZZ